MMISKLKSALAVACLGLSSIVFAGYPVNINTADVNQLAEALDGIGPAKAQAIVDYRELHGPFAEVDELIKVKGIGPKMLEKNRDNVLIE